MRRRIVPAAILVGVLAIQAVPPLAEAQISTGSPVAEPPLTSLPAPRLDQSAGTTNLAPAQPAEHDRTLPINLATALRLADARPLLIEAARAAVETEYGLYEQARVLWLPTVYLGVDYQRHDGGQ